MTPVGGKGCAGSECHSARTPSKGLRYDTPGLVFDSITKRPLETYAQLVSGAMPIEEEGGILWDENDLRLYRSWVCRGAFPE